MSTHRHVDVDGVSLAVTQHGSGAPVVCLTAIGHDALDFAPLAARIGDRFKLICIEWPGHGDSGPDHEAPSAARYARLLDGALQSLGVHPPILIGNSIGGAVAIRYAATRAVRALVLCDSGGLIEVTPTVRRFCRLFERFFAAGARGAAWYSRVFAWYYRIVLPTPAAARQRARIVARSRALAPILRDAWASFRQPDADVRDLAAALDLPVWIAWARRDRVIPLAACKPSLKRLRHARIDTFDAGHAAFLERPDEFARGFIDFAAALPRVDAAPAR
jgi:pimeloyl-ACP methyl ester carboxylesterase